MKHSIAALLALLLSATVLSACSQEDTTLSIENPSVEIEDDSSESDAKSEQTDTSEDTDESEGDEDTDEKAADKQSDTDGIDQKNVKLEVSNQKSFGQIKVRRVATARDGWVSVHRSKEDGSIVLPDGMGEARVDSGESEDIIIDLWEAPEVGEKLWVLLHIDAGERGKYEYPGKDAPVKKSGETMARSLVVQGEEKEEEDEDE